MQTSWVIDLIGSRSEQSTFIYYIILKAHEQGLSLLKTQVKSKEFETKEEGNIIYLYY